MLSSNKTSTALYTTSNHLVWIEAHIRGGAVTIVDGQRVALETQTLPPSRLEVQPHLRRRTSWGVALPLPHRICCALLPPLEGEELASGANWEARKVLRTGTESVLGFETVGVAPGGQQALLMATRSEVLNPWLDWLREVLPGTERLETSVTAFARCCQWMAQSSDNHRQALVYVHGDANHSCIVVRDKNTLFGIRSLPGRADVRTAEGRWQGEEGLRLLRESLLYVEDHHPRLQLQGVVGTGTLEPEWLREAAAVVGLPLVQPPPPPEALPEGLLEESAWIIPFGVLLGEAL